MSQIQTDPVPFVADFEAFVAPRSGEPEFLRVLRQQGIDHFSSKGLPTIRDEEWRFTNVAPLGRVQFELTDGQGREVESDEVHPFFFDGAIHLVFVDGVYAPDLSQAAELPEGVFVGTVASVLAEDPERIEPWLGRRARVASHAFVALNTAFLQDGLFVHVPKGTVLEQPVHVLNVARGGGRSIVSHLRHVIVAEESSQLTVLESYRCLEDGGYFNCPVTEVYAAKNAHIDHYKLQRESTDAFHMATLEIVTERDATVRATSVSLGGGLVRNDFNGAMVGEHSEVILNGLYFVDGEQVVDHHMLVEHVAPNCHSWELFKGILEGRGKTVFNGKIHVYQAAQKTDAKQSNRNLLLSKGAIAHSNPQLEIYADDVRCTHGSTVGELDDEAVFYLRSRGIGEAAARSLLTFAFASEVVQTIRYDAVREHLEEFLFARLPGGEVVRQAV